MCFGCGGVGGVGGSGCAAWVSVWEVGVVVCCLWQVQVSVYCARQIPAHLRFYEEHCQPSSGSAWPACPNTVIVSPLLETW